MNTIFDNLSKDVDLSIFRESKKDPKSHLRRHYLSLVGLLEYVDILNGGLPGRTLPEGMTVDDVKRMVSHAINDLDTKEAMSTDSSLPEHEYVDLGLPSGTLWATENIKDAEGNDLYFAWGETRGYAREQIGTGEGKRPFSSEYKFGPDYIMEKYNETDGLIVLEPEDDAARVNWGEEWKIPASTQYGELTENTEYEWTEIDGVPGLKLTSKVEGYTDKFIFFPAVGRTNTGSIYGFGDTVKYWSSSVSRMEYSEASILSSSDNSPWPGIIEWSRYTGCPIRPIRV